MIFSEMLLKGTPCWRWGMSLLVAGVSLLAQGNLVVNGDFEGKTLMPWKSPQRSQSRELHTLSGDTSYGAQCLIVKGDPENKHNKFITLIQDIPTLKQGETYLLSARVRAGSTELRKGFANAEGKEFKVAVREATETGATLRYKGLTVNLTDDTWRYYELMFTPHKQAARHQLYIISSGLSAEDAVAVDNVRLWLAGDAGLPFNPDVPATAARPKPFPASGFDAQIDATTGLLHSLATERMILQPAASHATMVTVERDGRETALDGHGTPSVGFVAKAEYSVVNGMFREVVTVEALQDFADPVKIGVRHGFRSQDWGKLLGALRPIRVLPANAPTIFSYLGDPGDLNPGVLDQYQHTAFPLVILESDTHYLMIGSTEFDQFVTLAPNHPVGYVPAWQRNPRKTRQGQRFRFETNWRLFDRQKYMLRDVWRFYQEQLHTENPSLKPYLPALFTEERAFYPGVFGSHTYLMKEREDRLPPGANIWFYATHDTIHERYRTSGSWWSEGNAFREKIEANALKKYMAYLQQERGFKLVMYLRQLANLRDRESGLLPEDWFLKTPGGALHLYGGGYQVKLQPHVAKEVGYDTFPWGQYDFGNPDFRSHYMESIFAAMEFYQPKAIGWDMGSNHEEFSVIAETYTRLRRDGHRIHVVANEGAGPTQPYTDMVLLENGQLGGKSSYDFEVNRAYTTALVCLERYGIFRLAFDANTKGIKTWLNDRGLAENKRYLTHLLAQRPELKDERIEAARLCQLRASIFDLALGASPGYMEEAAPVPPVLTRFAGEVNGLLAVNRSFAVMFPNRSNIEGRSAVSAWRNDRQFRLVAFNDDSAPVTRTVLLDKGYLETQHWSLADLKKYQAFHLTPDGERAAAPALQDTQTHITLSFELPAFTALCFEANK